MDSATSASLASLPLLCLLLIMKHTSSIKSFVTTVIKNSKTKTELEDILDYIKTSQEFHDRIWMYNCGVVGHLIFEDEYDNEYYLICHPDELLQVDYSFRDYYYFNGEEPDDIMPSFFTALFSSYFELQISNGVDAQIYNIENLNMIINSVFGFTSYTELFSARTEKPDHIESLNERFARLYPKYYKDFKDGLHSSRNRNCFNEAITPKLLELEIKRHFGVEHPDFLGPSTDVKSNHHDEKQFQESRHSRSPGSVRKEKLKTTKHRTSPKNKREKYRRRLDVYA